MAETALTVQSTDVGGAELATAAANADGNSFPNDGYTVLVVTNGDASPTTVTLQNQGLVTPDEAKQFDADVDVAIPAGETWVVGPFSDKQRWNDSSGSAHVTYSSVTSLSVSAVRVY